VTSNELKLAAYGSAWCEFQNKLVSPFMTYFIVTICNLNNLYGKAAVGQQENKSPFS
jgi:hypothetical protein